MAARQEGCSQGTAGDHDGDLLTHMAVRGCSDSHSNQRIASLFHHAQLSVVSELVPASMQEA